MDTLRARYRSRKCPQSVNNKVCQAPRTFRDPKGGTNLLPINCHLLQAERLETLIQASSPGPDGSSGNTWPPRPPVLLIRLLN